LKIQVWILKLEDIEVYEEIEEIAIGNFSFARF
jgi:hypothetical protein